MEKVTAMGPEPDDFEELLKRASEGDGAALSHVLLLQRDRLTTYVTGRIDRRLSARIDVADIVQDTLIDAACKFIRYYRERPIPVQAWLEALAEERISRNHRAHLRTKKRSIFREVPQSGGTEGKTSGDLVKQAVSPDKTPSSFVARRELYAEVECLMKLLPERDQELLRLRFVEQLPLKQIAAQLHMTPDAARTRQLRALRRLRELLDQGDN